MASPCVAAAVQGCAACKGEPASPAYQLNPGSTRAEQCQRCYSLGSAGQSVVALSAADSGFTLTLNGGHGGRSFTYHFVCDSLAVADAGPEPLVHASGMNYDVTWKTPHACGKAPPTCPKPPPPPPIAKPSAAQLRWMQDEIGAVGHFNMGTFEACGIGLEGEAKDVRERMALPSASTFAPTGDVDPETWVRALASVGVTRAVLVVSHGCGFNTFPSRTAFPEFGFVYNYSVKYTKWQDGKADIARLFVDACRKHSIRPGFYHGSVNNAFLNVVGGKVGAPTGIPGQAVVTQAQYYDILLANLRQLWTDYGELAEVWFDGGVPEGVATRLWALHQELQPDAVAFQGPFVGSQPNLIRWAGTEGGHVTYPFWSAADAPINASAQPGPGSVDGAVFAPGEADTCFQGSASEGGGERAPYGGCWFYNAGMKPKSLASLVSSYHDTVGKNSFWLLDWSPTQAGGAPPKPHASANPLLRPPRHFLLPRFWKKKPRELTLLQLHRAERKDWSLGALPRGYYICHVALNSSRVAPQACAPTTWRATPSSATGCGSATPRP